MNNFPKSTIISADYILSLMTTDQDHPVHKRLKTDSEEVAQWARYLEDPDSNINELLKQATSMFVIYDSHDGQYLLGGFHIEDLIIKTIGNSDTLEVYNENALQYCNDRCEIRNIISNLVPEQIDLEDEDTIDNIKAEILTEFNHLMPDSIDIQIG